MKFGMSCYCLDPAMKDGTMSVDDVVDYAVAHGCEHIEFVPFRLPFVTPERTLDWELIDHVREKCKSAGIEISTYSVNANLLKTDSEEEAMEIERVKRHIDVAEGLGLSRMRFDVASFVRPFSTNTIYNFNREFPQMVKNGTILCDYAAEKGINIVMENHGFFINGSERVLRLIEAIDRPNLKMTVDVGNFLCVDEDPVAAVKRCLHLAEMIHLKDFYIRKKELLPDQTEMFNCNNGSWFETMGGRMIRGSILGQGDMDIWEILRTIKHSDFDGYISLEFEGMEPCEKGTEIGLAMARAIWDKV
ncbi:sugar phosphate isomerase/epimerase family protein [Acetatifactor aquisgranensis]|uniref:sugar phosphate isomerase/epimerase family protein n=1 Tax=Acetatifactor aquisgranensis TaxID=2941233 RepID=UPI00203C9DCD|nr:sugar phosphate isomerase/epimerase [Acetatifactor aquisgranensis]